MRSIIANLILGGLLIAVWVGFILVYLTMWSEVQP